MKICIIGPVPPYRGGISHSNTVLSKNLSKNHNVINISFKRQFPNFLYPGGSQKDTDSKADLNAVFLIDSINPISWLKTARYILKENPDKLIFQWWSPFFSPCYSAIAWLIRRLSKIKIIVVCQNVTTHENRRIDSILAKLFFRNANNFATLSKSDKLHLLRLLPKAKAGYMIEGTYDEQVGRAVAKEEAKKALGFQGKNILFFGFVRPYKGLVYLLEAMKETDGIMLHIVGEFWSDKADYISQIERLGIKDKLKIIDKYVSDEEAVRYFCACDCVVLPYTSSTESGIIQLAFGLGCPVITTDVGGNPDLIKNGVTGLLVKPRDSAQLAKAIKDFYANSMEGKIRRQMKSKKSMFDWDKNKEKILFGDY